MRKQKTDKKYERYSDLTEFNDRHAFSAFGEMMYTHTRKFEIDL